jgi:hypothetical protein
MGLTFDQREQVSIDNVGLRRNHAVRAFSSELVNW